MRAAVVSVVIPTKDRPELLRRCLDAVLRQESDVPFEVVVANDAGCPVDGVVGGDERCVLVDGPGRGPAAARNAAIAATSGEVVLFTDDDAVPQPGWLRAAVSALRASPEAAGVAGRVESPAFDPLYEHSVRNEGGVGNFLTCNIAYRRDVLVRLGGFDEGFPYPAGEDRDLGYRAQRLGPVLYESTMVVLHPPRLITVAASVKRARFLESEWRLHAKHPQTRPPRWSTRWGPLARLLRHWQRAAADDGVRLLVSPRRAGRFAGVALGQVAVASWLTLWGRRSAVTLPPIASSAGRSPLRVAWIGPVPRPGGGAAGCAWEVVAGLAHLGCEIDCFLAGDHDEIPRELRSLPGVRVVNFDTCWRYDRWYSNAATTKVLTGLAAAAWGRRRLASLVVEQHRMQPYEVVYQFSTIELFGLKRHLAELPPLVSHPSTHAAGELRGIRAERHLAARCEPRWRRLTIEALQAVRSRRQRRDIGEASKVLAISRRFADHLTADYGLDPERVTVVPNPVDVDELRPGVNQPERRERHVLAIARVSVRKGIDALVELSHRLADLEGRVVLDIVGAETLWSDYRPLLADLHPGVARYHGYLQRADVAALLASTDVLVQPATFEPFGLSVAEALACGVPVVATDEVGAAEAVDPACCIVVPAGDAAALDKGVRGMLQRLEGPEGAAVRTRARAEAERLFAPPSIAALAYDALAEASQTGGRPA